MSDAPTTELGPGRRLGQYEIRSRLGAGGMGAVYLAHDSLLNRPVALKVLKHDSDEALGSHARLLREAQAASALNHPNIVTVYEIGSEEGIDFIAMEHIEGETLSKIVARGPALREMLRVAIQVADALTAAHSSGIVHRDLKPGNIMVTGRHLAKVLDFGIARIEPHGNPETRATQTMTRTHVAGTLAYMSPEQAEGKDVDGRSDIFSFGCVLYEMVTRRRAFQQETEVGTLAAVVAKDPPPLRELAPGLPKPVERVINGCLKKNRAERWQSVADVKLLLEAALADLDLADPPNVRRWPSALVPLLAVMVLVASGLASWQWLRPGPKPPRPANFRRVTAGRGFNAFPAISRNGSMIAYASDQAGGNLDIYVGQIGGREAVRLTTDPGDDTEPAFSSDGARVAYRSERGGGGIWVSPTLPGDAVLLAPNGRSPRFSPDGKWLAYWDGRESQDILPDSAHVFLMEAGGGQPRAVATDLVAALYPVWSQTSDSLLVLGRRATDAKPDWWIVPIAGGASKKTGALQLLERQGLLKSRSPMQGVNRAFEWLPSGVLFSDGNADCANLWEFRMPNGPAVAVTEGPGYHLYASASASLTVFSHQDWRARIASAPLGGADGRETPAGSGAKGPAAPPQPLFGESQPDATSPSVSADGRRIAYRSIDRFLWSVRLYDSATNKDIAIVSGPTALYNPRISGNGAVVVYSDRLGHLYSVPSAGGAIKRVCSGCGTVMGVSADGNLISFEPFQAEDLMFYDVTLQAKVKAADRPANSVLSGGRFSPDGKWMAFHARTRSTTAQVFTVRIDGVLPVPREQWIPITDGQAEELEPAWAADGSAVYFLSDRDGFRCIRGRRLDASGKPVGEPFEAAPFHSARVSLRRLPGTTGLTGLTGLSAVPGRLIFAMGEVTGDIWLEEK